MHGLPGEATVGVDIVCQGVIVEPGVVSQSDQTTLDAAGSLPPVGSIPTLFLAASGSVVPVCDTMLQTDAL